MAAIAPAAPGTPRSTSAPSATVGERILDAAIGCVAVQGVRATTVDDVARAAGCGRATVYRTFPGGRDELIQRAGLRQIEHFAAAAEARLAAAEHLEDLLVSGITGATTFFLEHGALRHLIEHEPEVVAAQVGFDRMDAVFATVADFAVPHLTRFLPEPRAVEAAEWVSRLVLSYLVVPNDAVDLTTEDDARRLVQDHVLPGLAADLIEPHPTDRSDPRQEAHP
jgi:AcrR family transcriptional regulator